MIDIDRLSEEERFKFDKKYSATLERVLWQVSVPREMQDLSLIDVDEMHELRVNLMLYLRSRDQKWFP